MRRGLKVSIGLILANAFPVPAPFVTSYTALLQQLLTGEGNRILPPDRQITDARIITSHAFPIDTARNETVQLFLDEDDGDYLLFLDTDMTHPPDLPHRLVKHRLDLVTGRYNGRREPFHTIAMRKTGPGPNDYQSIDKLVDPLRGVVPIDAAGAGCLLIARRVLEDVRRHVGADEWFRYQDSPRGIRTVSEDMFFFEQARAIGHYAFLDCDAICGHVGNFVVNADWHEPFKARAREIAEARGMDVDAIATGTADEVTA